MLYYIDLEKITDEDVATCMEEELIPVISRIYHEDEDFAVDVTSLTENQRDIMNKAVDIAIHDLKDESSFLYRYGYLPFAYASCLESDYISTWITYTIKLLVGFSHLLDNSEPTVDAYLACSDLEECFSIPIPLSRLYEVFSHIRCEWFTTIPEKGYKLLELGPYTMADYVLPKFYEYLARWCPDSENPLFRNPENWRIGIHQKITANLENPKKEAFSV